MTEDEVSQQRQKRTRSKKEPIDEGPSFVVPANQKGDVPDLPDWLTAQHRHSNPQMAAAAQHCRERWNLSVVPAARIDRTLAGEQSEHLIGWRMLLDEYREIFNIESDPKVRAVFLRQAGSMVQLVPDTIDYCSRCRREAIPGTGLCARHGGQWIDAEERKNLSVAIAGRMLELSNRAVHTLTDLMDNAKSEDVRLRAAQAVLDRAGFPVGVKVEVEHKGTLSFEATEKAASLVQERLEQIRRTREAIPPVRGGEEASTDVVEAEVIDDQPAIS